MALPIRVFWLLCDQIPRIEAHTQRQTLSVAACAQDGGATKEMIKALEAQMGEIVVEPPAPVRAAKKDEGAMDLLRSLS